MSRVRPETDRDRPPRKRGDWPWLPTVNRQDRIYLHTGSFDVADSELGIEFDMKIALNVPKPDYYKKK